MLTFLEDKEGQPIPEDQHLPARPMKAPGKIQNEAKKQREEEVKREAEVRGSRMGFNIKVVSSTLTEEVLVSTLSRRRCLLLVGLRASWSCP